MDEIVLPEIDTPPPTDAGQGAQVDVSLGSAPGEPLPEDRATTEDPSAAPAGGDSVAPGDGLPAPAAEPAPSPKAQARIDKLTREAREAQTALAIEREVNRRLRESPNGMTQQPARQPAQPALPEPPREPKPEDFRTQHDYTVARATYAAQKELYDFALSAMQAEQQAAGARQRQAATQRVLSAISQTQTELGNALKTEGPQRFADFDEVMRDATADVPLNVQIAIRQSNDPVGVSYYIGRHQDLIGKLTRLSPFQLGATVGKIATAMKQPASAPASSQSFQGGAPPPGRPAGSRSGNPMTYRDDYTPEEHIAWERANGMRR